MAPHTPQRSKRLGEPVALLGHSRAHRRRRLSSAASATATRGYTPESLPRQNRVTPFGDLIAIPERGTLMGNRGGRLHDATQTIDPPFVYRRWIAWLL